jgi:hypothetical protein
VHCAARILEIHQAMMIRALLFVFVATAEGSIQEALDGWCSLMEKAQHLSSSDTKEIEDLAKDDEKLFAPKIDCSFDPFDKMVGYNLEDKTLDECIEADSNQIASAFGGKEFQGVSAKCIETIADEKKGLGAAWAESSYSIDGGEPITLRLAYRFAFNEEGLITSYHYIGDMAPAIMEYGSPKMMSMSALQTGSWPGMMVFLGAIALASLSFAAVTMAKMREAQASSELAGYQGLNA